MSDSFRKTPRIKNSTSIVSTYYKKHLHKKERRLVKIKINNLEFDFLNKELFIYDDWESGGKQYLSDETPKGFTKSEWIKYKKKLLRK